MGDFDNVILEKKHYYMQVLTNANMLKKNAELENLQDILPENQLEEVSNIWYYTFVGLLREGLVYDYIANKNDSDKDIIRLTIDNVQFDCKAIIVKKILGEDYDKIISTDNKLQVEEKPINLMPISEKKDKKEQKTKKELQLEKELNAIKQNKNEEIEKLLYEINHDAATGLKNKRAFLEDCKKLKDSMNYAFVSIDVNNLKMTNDTLGHAAGDKLLNTVSKALTNSFRHHCYRTGGDEFVLILENINEALIKEGIKEAKEHLSELSALDKDGINYSFSYGYAFNDTNKKYTEVLEIADKKMYEDKKIFKESNKNKTKWIDDRVNEINEKNTNNKIETLNKEKSYTDVINTQEDKTLEKFTSDTTKDIKEDITKKNEDFNINNNMIENSNKDNNIPNYNFNSSLVKFKDADSFVYDIYDLELLPPGGVNGELFKAIIIPLKMYENNTHPEIMAFIIDKLGHVEKYVSNKLSSLKIKYKENELLLRGSFVKGHFQSYIVLAGATMSMGFNLNKKAVIEKRPDDLNTANWGHLVFEQFGIRFHVIPMTNENDDNGIAQCFICTEDIKDTSAEREVFLTESKGFTVYRKNHKAYQILTYWQDNLLCAEALETV